MSLTVAIFIGVAALATSAMTAIVGFGGGMVLIAVLLAFVDPLVAIPVHAAIQLMSNGTRSIIRWHEVEWWIVVRFSALLLPSGALAMLLATSIPTPVLRLAIAVTVLAATWVPERLGQEIRKPGTGTWIATGAVIGGLNIIVGATGPLQAPLFRSATSTRMAFVGTFAMCQTLGHLTKIVLFGATGFGLQENLAAIAFGAVGVLIGTRLGSSVLDRMPEAGFQYLYLVSITAVAVYLLIDAAFRF